MNVPQPRQTAGVYQLIAVTQQPDDGAPPDFFHRLFFEEQRTPDAVLYVESAAGDGDVDMRVLIELTAVGVQGAENADLDALFAGPAKHGPCGRPEQRVEQRPVVVEERPEQVGHGKGDVLPVAVGKNVLLFGNSLLGGFHAA
ncbi:hypothetical protein D3C81_1350770 [compost metagenome]